MANLNISRHRLIRVANAGTNRPSHLKPQKIIIFHLKKLNIQLLSTILMSNLLNNLWSILCNNVALISLPLFGGVSQLLVDFYSSSPIYSQTIKSLYVIYPPNIYVPNQNQNELSMFPPLFYSMNFEDNNVETEMSQAILTQRLIIKYKILII